MRAQIRCEAARGEAVSSRLENKIARPSPQGQATQRVPTVQYHTRQCRIPARAPEKAADSSAHAVAALGFLAGWCAPALAEGYQPSPYTPGWQVWVGALAGAIPFAIGAWEFSKRILIQRRCERCDGSGLILRGRFYKKCPECGGFFPWQGWGRFFTSTATPGNGGVLRAPRGQTSIFYKVPEPRKPSKAAAEEAGGSEAEEMGRDELQ